MVPTLDVLRSGMVGCVLRKVDGTLTVAIESVLLLLDTELSDEVLHPYYFLAGVNIAFLPSLLSSWDFAYRTACSLPGGSIRPVSLPTC